MHGLALTSPAEEAEGATLAALLRCCVREVAGPRGLVWPAPPYLLLRVGGALLRARTRGGAALRFEGRPERLEAGAWHPLTTDELVRLAQADLGPGPAVMPTSSVRAVYAPDAGVCVRAPLGPGGPPAPSFPPGRERPGFHARSR